ncbi:MAG: nickel pincer cofactor biosynthesis protein LarB [Chthonomonadales bacterium]
MEVNRLQTILQSVQSGEMQIDVAMTELKDLPYEDLGFAKLDHHRTLRTGFPEVIFAQGKTIPQVLAIADRLSERSHKVLITRCSPECSAAVTEKFPGSTSFDVARICAVPGKGDAPDNSYSAKGKVLIVTAGTADIPVAEEAAITAHEMGSEVERLFDVGVAGLHRLLDQRERLFSARVIVVVAGMEGALASVVGGLVHQPVVAVPTSVGYGASFQGLAPLLTMLNSCASGVCVMNIDNGFGAGYFANMLCRM